MFAACRGQHLEGMPTGCTGDLPSCPFDTSSADFCWGRRRAPCWDRWCPATGAPLLLGASCIGDAGRAMQTMSSRRAANNECLGTHELTEVPLRLETSALGAARNHSLRLSRAGDTRWRCCWRVLRRKRQLHFHRKQARGPSRHPRQACPPPRLTAASPSAMAVCGHDSNTELLCASPSN